MKNKIFVYGTLMTGMRNYYKYLSDRNPIGSAELDGYVMYDLGTYPGIVEGNGKIKGEIYEVDEETLKRIDILEEEGEMYIKKCVHTSLGEAYVYIYNYSVEGKFSIPYGMQPYNKLVYYVAYGSNMVKERFMCYIEGGICPYNNKSYIGCKNKSLPIKVKSTTLPYDMYYSKSSSSWNGSAVSFLDYTKAGFAYGRAYLISEEQFDDIKSQEGNWYSKTITLDKIDGFRACTFSSQENLIHSPYSSVLDNYKRVLKDGLKEYDPNMAEENIERYLEKCGI